MKTIKINYDPRRVDSGIAAIALILLCIFLSNPIIPTLQSLMTKTDPTTMDLKTSMIMTIPAYLLLIGVVLTLANASKKTPLSLDGLVWGLSFGLVFGLFCGLGFVVKGEVIIGLMWGLVCGLAFGLIWQLAWVLQGLKKKE